MSNRIIILGAGYAGLVCAMELRKRLNGDEGSITLINKHNYHQLMTQLHETAVGARTDHSIRIPLASALRGKEVELVKGTVTRICPNDHVVELDDGLRVPYDYLVIALGSEPEYFGINGMKEYAFILKSMNQARLIRTHIESCFARYPLEHRADLLRFVVGGAGFSGIELIGELADALPLMAQEAGIDPALVEIFNVEAASGILPGFDEELVHLAQESLQARGVKFLVGVPITAVEPGSVHLKTGQVIASETIVWTGGVRGNQLVVDAGFEVEPRGRAKVNEFLQSISHDHVYIIGDCAFVIGENGRALPPTAQIAWQMGAVTGKYLYQDIKGGVKEPFHPEIMGSLASLGRKDAVGKIFKSYRMHGRAASAVKEASQYRYLAKIGSVFSAR